MNTPNEVDEFLEHYGTRGMKWGVRKNLQRLSPNDRAAYLTNKDAAWRAKVNANPKLAKMARISARDSKKQIRKLKQEYNEAGHNVKRNGLHQTRYDTEVAAILQHSAERAAHKVHGTSASGLLEVTVHRHPDGNVSATIGMRHNQKIEKQIRKIVKSDQRAAKKVEHADTESMAVEDFVGLTFNLVLDDEGFVDDILTSFDEDIQHEAVAEFLEHYGVRGMHWGVRRSKAQLSRASTPSGKSDGKPPWQSPPAPKSPSGSASSHHPSHISNDQIVYAALKAKARTHGVHSLSNEEIRVLTTRAETLKKAHTTFPRKKTKKEALGKFIVEDLLIKSGKKTLQSIADEQMKQFGIKKGLLPKKQDDAEEALKKARKLVADADKD